MTKEIVLIVEDNLILRDGLGDILSCDGFEVMLASNGREALDLMKTVTPDMIISDIAMPEMDGFDFLHSVRIEPQWVSIPFVFLTARGDKEDVLTGKNLGVDDYLVKPLTREELLTTVHARLERSQQLRVAQLQQAYATSLIVLANAIEIRDPYTRGHVERVTDISLVVAAELGWQRPSLEQLRYGSILHDIGKIYVRDTTLKKPGRLNDEEWAEIQRHPVTGADLIKSIPYLAPAIPVIRHHHERWDGKGYPDQLSGEDIPLAARIIAVADSFDAMTTYRPYCQTRSLEEAYAEILNCSEKQFDPQVVSAFAKAWQVGKVHAIWKRWFNGR
jgi:putative two-component system response regulator